MLRDLNTVVNYKTVTRKSSMAMDLLFFNKMYFRLKLKSKE